MANNRTDMSKIRHILRLFSTGRSKLHISMHTGVSRNTVIAYINTFESSGISYSQLDDLSDKELESLFQTPQKPLPDKLKTLYNLFPELEKQLKRKGMNRQLLWEMYHETHPNGYKRSQFNYHYSKWKVKTNPTMHIEHKAGDKMYVDYAGDKLSYTDLQTGELCAVEVFVSILGASQLIYAEAVMSQKKEDLITGCESAFHFYGGVPAAVVTDNLKAAVTKSSKYEPTINETFAEFAEHYGVTIIAARAYKPRDKSLVEGAVKILYQRVYTKLQNQIFYSLQELNEAIQKALEELNNSLLKGRDYSRRQQYEEIEREVMGRLPASKFEFKKQHYSTVAKNGYAYLSEDRHSYSVPYQHIGNKVKILYTRQTVEIYYKYERIALHIRAKGPRGYTTDIDHLASTHRYVAEWNPEFFKERARSIHPDVELYITRVLLKKSHPELAYRSCSGILSFAKRVGNDRFIRACQRALFYELYNYDIIDKILRTGLDRFNDQANEQSTMPSHENIRGQQYYQ